MHFLLSANNSKCLAVNSYMVALHFSLIQLILCHSGSPKWIWMHFSVLVGTVAMTLLNFIELDDGIGLLLAAAFTFTEKGHVNIIANDQGHSITPSWVSFTEEECLIGDQNTHTEFCICCDLASFFPVNILT